VFEMSESRNTGTGKITVSVPKITSYSDRPQYLAQASTGRIYFSTRPTQFAPEGTIRYVETDPIYRAPDPRIIHSYVEGDAGTDFRFAIFNLDSIDIQLSPANSPLSDRIVAFDHVYGSDDPAAIICVNGFDEINFRNCELSTLNGQPVDSISPVGAGFNPYDPSIEAVLNTMRRLGSDTEGALRLNLAEMALHDTTFVTASFSNHWIAFGEGNSAPATNGGRVIMVYDSIKAPAATEPQFSSPTVTVRDLTENASERVFGIALDKNGQMMASHGLESYMTEVFNPFHLRLQGKYNSLDEGAGIALHPDADGRNTPMPARLAFVASATGEIEIVDVAYFINRGHLTLKYPIYGPLKASKPMPGDDPSVVLKLFAITQRGLIVVDVTQNDIKPGPP
jgi:hypothetical protein